ncbi:MAG: tRNA dihydrouridine(20/20a) synthase DusA, partial [Pseudomonadales bacterium]
MNTTNKIQHRFCVAPMMEWTDRHCRYFLRLFSQHTLLYTEMITTGALLHGDAERFLRFNHEEQPVALQVGGSDPKELALAAQMGEQAGYNEINLNAGCPSDRVQRGKIGACLMAEPNLVAECMSALMEAVSIPVTIKCRTGINDLDSLEHLTGFVETITQAGCRCFIIHARIAVLEGLSPKQNRNVPP